MNLSGLKAKHWSELSGVGFLLMGNGAPPIERMLMKELHIVMGPACPGKFPYRPP